jgi:alanyl-tRNA synthetase
LALIEGKAQLLFQRSENLTFDMGELMKAACAIINGRGGGRSRQALGGGSEVEKLEVALQKAEDLLFDTIDSF